MTGRARILVVEDGRTSPDPSQSASGVDANPVPGAVLSVEQDPASACLLLDEARFDLVVVDLAYLPEAIEPVAEKSVDQQATLFAICDAASPELCRRAMGIGARDILPVDWRAMPGLGARLEAGLSLARETRHRHQLCAPSDDEYARLRARYEDLKSHYADQIRCFEDSQESYYLDLSRMMTIIGNIMDGIVFVDHDGYVSLMNAVAEDLLATKSFMAIGRPIGETPGEGELAEALREQFDLVRDRPEVVRTVEVHHATSQDLLYIKVRTTRVNDYRGQFAGTLTTLQDVTAEHKSDQLKNQYLSIVAHELRTPLTGIKTFSTMMAKGTLGELNAKQQRVTDSIREQSLRLEHQIDKLINLGNLESNEFGQDLEVFDMAELVEHAVAPFAQPAGDRRIDLKCAIESRRSMLKGDRSDIRRAVQVMVENAIKFTPDGGTVSVRVSEVESCTTDGDRSRRAVRVKISDNGVGIESRYHRRIFEKFFQVEDPLTRHYGGAGLGLFFARSIIEAHGSKIDVVSELGQGTEFTFDLLLDNSDVSPQRPEDADTATGQQTSASDNLPRNAEPWNAPS